MTDKESIRREWLARLAKKSEKQIHWGRAAEQLRKLQSYRNALIVFATPHVSLRQMRINCLLDGKDLIMAGPSMRNGFYLLKPHTIPFTELSTAVTYQGLEKSGQLISHEKIKNHRIDLLLADALTVDQRGTRLGDGNGFVDLSYGILSEVEAVQPATVVITVVSDEQLTGDTLPLEKWDVKVNGAVTPTCSIEFAIDQIEGKIYWEALQQERIKKISPLWKLSQKLK
jgi:5-formyltetrahydrofolate cyclo-ligase